MRKRVPLTGLIFVALCWAAAALAQPVAELHGPLAATQLQGHIMALRDPSRNLSLDDVSAPERADDWQAVSGPSADFGYTKDAIWLRVLLRNENAAVPEWRLHVRENFFQGFRVYLAGAQGTQVLEELHPTSPFSDREIAYPELVVPLPLPFGEPVAVYIRYWSGGSSEAAFAIRTPESFAVLAEHKTAKNFIYYGMMLFLVLAATAAFAVTRQFIFAAYAGYATCGLLFIMHADGNTFRYLWPNAPLFNGYASVLLGSGIILFGGNFARHFLQTFLYHPMLERIILTMMGVTLLVVGATLFADTQTVKKLLVLLSLISMLLYFASGLAVARTRFAEVRFYVLAWGGAVVSAGIMTARHWLGIEISEEVQFDSIRVVLVLDAALMGFAILDRFNQMKRNREEALEMSLSEARRSLSLSGRLQELEQRYALAVELTRSKERKLADAVHDLRQPIHALRLNVQALLPGEDAARTKPRPVDIEETFDYLEALVNRELASASGPGGVDVYLDNDAATDTNGHPAENVRLDQVLDALRDMFAAEARDKGLDLRVVDSTAQTALPPLALMRLATNLVSNAIKYTATGTVLVGLRRSGDSHRLEVHDTGPGLTEVDLQTALGRNIRLAGAETAQGSGLGLSIVAGIAREYGLTFGLLPRRGGTSVYVNLPPAT
ncbi:sensor histidine kinase [Primorskyibacter flagellatus]|uniref:sensor histidine kinase n=1 Tax=Primorskyibacter flagellatus TaxID=1387277 RepID=UPI003A934E81